MVRLEGIDSRSAAETLVGHELLVSADDRPELDEGEFHLLDLLGLEARLAADGPAVGTVSDLISGGNDLLEITTSEGRKLLIPFVEAIVPEVQLGGGLAAAHPTAGPAGALTDLSRGIDRTPWGERFWVTAFRT